MVDIEDHIIKENATARLALKMLDELPNNIIRTLFVVDNEDRLKGSVSDGDIRRGLLKGLEISDNVSDFMHSNFKYLNEKENNINNIKLFRQADIFLVPVLDEQFRILQILDLRKTLTVLPLTALIMAGGRGERLKPLTDFVPKPMLKIGEKSILEHNIDRLIAYGISKIYISVKYLKEQIIDFFGDGSSKGISIEYVIEDEPLGTIGALSLINQLDHADVLVMNSDLLTNIDFEDFYNFYKEKDATMAVASIPYNVNIPYAVLELNEHCISSFTEKPTFTYYSNGGIYLLKSFLKNNLTRNSFFNATDLMNQIIDEQKLKIVHYPLLGYWLDIGKHHDYIKAQEDIKHIKM